MGRGSVFGLSGSLRLQVYGWLSKLWSLFGSPKYKMRYYTKEPKRDHNFENHLYE